MKKIIKFLSLLDKRYRSWYLVKNNKGEIWLYDGKDYDYKREYSWEELLLTPTQSYMLGVFNNYSHKNYPIKVKSFLRKINKIELKEGIISE